MAGATDDDVVSALRHLMSQGDGTTQRRLALVAGVSEQAVSQWFTGTKQPGPRSMRRLLAFFTGRNSTDPADLERLIATMTKTDSKLPEAMNREVLDPPFERLRGTDPRKGSVVGAAMDTLERASRSADDAHQVAEEILAADPHATIRTSSILRWVLELAALSPERELRDLLGRLSGTWDLTTLAPSLLLAAPDVTSQTALIRALSRALIPCNQQRCATSEPDPDQHVPDVFAFVFTCRVASYLGLEERVIESVTERLDLDIHRCRYHAAIAFHAVSRLSLDKDCWGIAGPLIERLADRVGTVLNEPGSLPISEESQIRVLLALSERVGLPRVLETCEHALGFLEGLSRDELDAGDAATLTMGAVEYMKPQLLPPADINDRHTHVFLATIAGLMLQRAYALYVRSELDTEHVERRAMRKAVEEFAQAFFDDVPVPIPTLAQQIILDALVRTDLTDFSGWTEQYVVNRGTTAVLSIVASRWSSQPYRELARQTGTYEWLPHGVHSLDSAMGRPDVARLWAVGRLVYSHAAGEPRHFGSDEV